MNRNMSRGLIAIAMLAAASLACSALSSLTNGPLFQDDFSSTGVWGTGTDADKSVEYANNALRMQVFRDNYIVWSTPSSDAPYENVHVEVTVANNGTDSTTAFGIICDQQHPITDSYYYLVMTPGGEYTINKAALAQTDV